MEYLVDVTKTTKLKEGLTRALVMHKQTMILLFKSKKDVIIEAHHHPHAQMGYVFDGAFDFETPAKRYENKPGAAYIIKNSVIHKVIATENFYSMDIKYMGVAQQVKEISYNILQEKKTKGNFKLFEVELDRKENKIYKIISLSTDGRFTMSTNALSKYYLAVSEKCEITVPNNSGTIVLKPMRIYMYAANFEDIVMDIKTKDIEIFIFELI